MKSIVIPSDKKDLSTPAILLMALTEKALNQGEDINKVLNAFINSIPEDILSSNDKKARKRQFKALSERIQSSEISEFDMSEQIKESLNHEKEE